MRQHRIEQNDLRDFVRCFCADNVALRRETPRFRRFKYSDIVSREKASLDINWQQDKIRKSQHDNPQDLLKGILRDLEEAMNEFGAVENELLK